MDDEPSPAPPATAELPTRALRMRAKPWPFLYSVDPVGLVRNVRAAAVVAAAPATAATAPAATSPAPPDLTPEPAAPTRTVVRGWRGQLPAAAQRAAGRRAEDRGDTAPR